MTYVQSSIISLVVFGAAEYLLYPLDLWHCTDKVQHVILGHVAVYVLPAEAILGPALVYTYRCATINSSSTKAATHQSDDSAAPLLSIVTAAIATMLLYTGALAVSYLLIETTR